MEFDTQALVIGGGPSGAWAAEHLAQRGVSVILLEAGPASTEKLCSGLLNTEGQRALGCELPQHVRRAPFEPRLEFHDLDNRLRLRYSPGYWNMDRPSFDTWMRERAADAGAQVRYDCRVSRIELSATGVIVQTATGPIATKIAIDASGWRALGRKQHGNGAGRAPHIHAFQGIIESDLPEDSMWAIFKSGITPYYGWLVPKGNGRFLLGAGFTQGADSTRRGTADAKTTDPDPWSKLRYLVQQIECPGHSVRFIDDKPEGTPITTITSTSQLWWGAERLFTVGEAAGMVSPSSGDGIHFGLEHAHALADELVQAGVLNGGGADLHSAVSLKVGRRLKASLGELRFNCLKSRVAAKPLTRGIAARLLPLYLRRPVERIAL